MSREVIMIPQTKERYSHKSLDSNLKKRVAAYARVSTEEEEQKSSYNEQVRYYTNYIQSNPAWTFAGMYADEGITGTNTKKREGFKRMIDDAMNGKIDLILTKSIPRFARNTVDSLSAIRMLKEKGVGVYFEEHNINTLSSNSEMMISIFSAHAQEESRNISENVTWGKRKRFARGVVSFQYKNFLGYKKGENSPMIVEEEAEIVRLIYNLCLKGKSYGYIANYLEEKNIKTPTGKDKWQRSTIKSILQNEKYKGDAILQKTFTIDYLTHKTKKNDGEVAMYYVQNNHPAIISKEVFELVQEEIEKRSKMLYSKGESCFTNKVVCGECGKFYGIKILHSNSKYNRTVLRCNNKYKKNSVCDMPYLYEKQIKTAFIQAFNELVKQKQKLIEQSGEVIKSQFENGKLEDKLKRLESKKNEVYKKDCVLLKKQAQQLEVKDFEKDHAYNICEYDKVEKQIKEIIDKIKQNTIAIIKINEMVREMNDKQAINAFDEELWYSLIDRVVVCENKKLNFVFKNGMEIKV